MVSIAKSLNIRTARSSDERAIARLCRHAVGPGDYALRILREVIADGSLFLAWSGDELVGMTGLDRAIDGSGWLSMARTDPKWQGKGVALFLQQHIAEYGRKNGLKVLRLWTLSTNTRSIRACVKGGFRPVCETAHVSCSIRRRLKEKSSSVAKPIRRATLQLQSTYLQKMNGYFAYKWYFVTSTANLLEKLLRKGELYRDYESVFVLTKPDTIFGRPYCSFTLLDGPAASSFRKIRQTAAATLGRIRLGGYVPYNAYLLKAAEEAGFKRDSWSRHCIVFEKRI